MFTQLFGSYTDVIAAIIVLLSFVWTVKALSESIRSRNLEAIRQTFQDLTCEELSNSRYYVLHEDLAMPGRIPKSSEAYKHMHRVWVAYDNLGILVHHGMLQKKIALSMFSDQIMKCWQKLEPHIQYEEFIRGSYYQVYFKEI